MFFSANLLTDFFEQQRNKAHKGLSQRFFNVLFSHDATTTQRFSKSSRCVVV